MLFAPLVVKEAASHPPIIYFSGFFPIYLFQVIFYLHCECKIPYSYV